MTKKKKTPLWLLAVTWVARIICGGLFVFSGFVKGIDPWGTIFKVTEYLTAFGFDMPHSLLRLGVFALCVVEFIVGCFLVLGCFRKSCPWFAALIIVFMLPLSFWLAITDPLPDCGCFGDALYLSNWMTFGKNVVLMLGIVWLIFYNLKCMCLILPAFQWLAVVSSGIFLLVVELLGYFYQPLLDFRDYPVGSKVFADAYEENADKDYLFTYQKGDEIKDFDIDSLPDENDGWEFVKREEVSSGRKENEKENKGLHVFDVDTSEDITEDITEDISGEEEGRALLVLVPDVSEVSPSTTWKLNSLYDWCEKNDVKMMGIVSGSKDEIDNWEDLSMASYPIYVADDTVIKEIVRGNPGIVFLENGTIMWKSTLTGIDIDDFQNEGFDRTSAGFERDNHDILMRCVVAYLLFMAFLVLISFTPRLARLMTKGGLASKRGVRHH